MQQCFQNLLIVPVFLGLVGCAGTPETPDERNGVAPVFSVALDGAAQQARVEQIAHADAAEPSTRGPSPISVQGAPAFHVQSMFVRPGGESLMAPAITIYARQRANVTVINQTAYVETVAVEAIDDAWIADPIVGIVQDGVILEMCVDADGDDAVLAYRATVSNLGQPIPQRSFELLPGSTPVTVQMPKVESSEVAGVRRIVPGVTTRLATLETASGPVELRVLVTGADVVFPDFVDRSAEAFLGLDPSEIQDFEAPGSDAFALREWIDDRGDDFHIEVEALVVDGAAAADDARTLRSMEMTSRAVSGASMRASLDEAYVHRYEPVGGADDELVQPMVETMRSGISAEIGDDGALHLQWVTSPRWEVFTLPRHGDAPLDVPARQVRDASLDLVPGLWLVTLGRRPGGDTPAFRVRVTVQRRVASQTQATRKRRPPASAAR